MCGRPSITLLICSQAMPCSPQVGRGAAGGDQREAALDQQVLRHVQHARLVGIAHRNEGLAEWRRLDAGRFLARARTPRRRCGRRPSLRRWNAFPGRGSDRRSGTSRTGRSLPSPRNSPARFRASRPARASDLADHAARGDLGQRHADRLGHEGHRARGARIHFEHEDRARPGSRTGYSSGRSPSAPAPSASTCSRRRSCISRAQRIRRQRAGGIAGMHAGFLDVLHDAADQHVALACRRSRRRRLRPRCRGSDRAAPANRSKPCTASRM